MLNFPGFEGQEDLCQKFLFGGLGLEGSLSPTGKYLKNDSGMKINEKWITKGQGRSQDGKGGKSPPKLKKIVVEKWCYFRRLYF